MLSALEAERLIFTLITPISAGNGVVEGAVETVPLENGLNRVLAEPVTSALDFPHWDNSAMDGYAVRASDVRSLPATLSVIEEIPAGKAPQKAIEPGQAARILTGAMMPEGADAVVMQENTERQADAVTILQGTESRGAKSQESGLSGWEPGKFVRRRGSYLQTGDELLPAGRRVAPAEIALLAAAQQTTLKVFRRPRVAILSTGSELVSPGQPLGPGQIVDSNQYALTALVAQTGAVPVPMGIVADDRAAVKQAIASALAQADMVLSTGGVSVGDYDYVDDVLAELGGTLHIRAVAVKPGKPLTVASFGRTEQAASARPDTRPDTQLYFGLPGNPASAMVGFWRFVGPAIAKLSGQSGPWTPAFVQARAISELRAGGGRETYLWGQLSLAEGGYTFGRAAGLHQSGNLVNLANTTGLGVVPQGETTIAVGESVRVLKVN